jgi:hypothetical protein
MSLFVFQMKLFRFHVVYVCIVTESIHIHLSHIANLYQICMYIYLFLRLPYFILHMFQFKMG